MQNKNLLQDLKNPLLYFYKWYAKYSNGKIVYHFDTIDDFKNNIINIFGKLDFKNIIEFGLMPLRKDLKPIIIDLKPFKNIKYKKPVYWRRRVFCSDSSYIPFHIYIVGYQINICGTVISFSLCCYPNGTIEVVDKEPKNIDKFINNLKHDLGGINDSRPSS